MKHIMALDQGTTSSRCILFNKKGEIRAWLRRNSPSIILKAAWVEHDAMEIWDCQIEVAKKALGRSALPTKTSPPSASPTSAKPPLWDKNTGKPRLPRDRLAVPLHRGLLR